MELAERSPAAPDMDHSSNPGTALKDKDPVCGMTVDPATAKHKLEHAGKIYYFCCAPCLEKFRADPEGYLSGRKSSGMGMQIVNIGLAPAARPSQAKTAPTPASTAYVCPMCPEVRASKPGPCPRCGMALEPEMPAGRAPRGIHLPHASGNCPAGTGQLPDLRHGAGAAHRHRAGRRKSRTARHDSPLLDQRGADRSTAGRGHG